MLKNTMKVLTAILLVGAYAAQVQAAASPQITLEAGVSGETIKFVKFETKKNKGIISAPERRLLAHSSPWGHIHVPIKKPTSATTGTDKRKLSP